MPANTRKKSFEYCQCVVLSGMKLVDLHKAQANVGPHTKKKRIRALAGAGWKIGH